MELLPVSKTLADNERFINEPACHPGLDMTIDFFDRIGYNPPWIGYFVLEQGRLVGAAAFKGRIGTGPVEVAYATFDAYQNQGIGREICRQLVLLALATDPTVRITARTLPEENYSTRILRKNGFVCLGTIWDDEDGEVWEWEYEESRSNE